MSESPNTPKPKPKRKPKQAKIETPMQYAVARNIRKQNGRPNDKRVRVVLREHGVYAENGAHKLTAQHRTLLDKAFKRGKYATRAS